MELREPCKSYGNYLQKTPDILSTLNPFVAIALTSKKGITLFPFSDILKPVHGCFFRRIFLGHRLIFLEFTLSRKIPFIWCNPSELVFEQVSTNTKNRVSFWALRFREKSSLVFCPTCLVSETSYRDRLQRVSISRFRLDCRKRNRGAIKSRRFLSSNLRYVAQKRWMIHFKEVAIHHLYFFGIPFLYFSLTWSMIADLYFLKINIRSHFDF